MRDVDLRTAIEQLRVEHAQSRNEDGDAERRPKWPEDGITQSLGVAFNSTFVALLLSLVLMLLVHQIQLLQERLVLESRDYCGTRLIRYLETGPKIRA